VTQSLAALGITPERIQFYDQRIPRYTSYPTAPYWKPSFGPLQWQEHLERSSQHDRDLSLYVHIPFCGKRCLFCACNVIVTRKEGVARDYIDTLAQEVALVKRHWRGTGKVTQLHLGGGTPNYLTAEEMSRLANVLGSEFEFSPHAERSIEVDPRIATPEQIEALATEHGFARISFGVQDFHEQTQLAIGREQTQDCTFANVAAARRSGFRSVNIDLIYGLPMQTAESWAASVGAILDLRPDRIALYNFAFLPGRLAHQRFLDEGSLPNAGAKLEMFIEAHDHLTAAGYEFIGMDHYALADDSLTKAQQAGTLRRNFMGYTTLRGTDLLSFGTSAISDYQGAFAQNVKKLNHYGAMISEGLLPVERGLLLSEDDRLRQYVIEELMCNGRLRYDGTHSESIRVLVESRREELAPLENDGLLRSDSAGVVVTQKGRMFLRNIAVVFDAYVNAGTETPLFSRAV